MGDAALFHRLLGRMREMPAFYRVVRGAYRGARAVPRELLRRLGPPCSRFGPPKGLFSARAMLEAGEVEGRFGWRGQEIPKAPPDSMIVRCGFRQDNYQPWPAFWTRHQEIRLAGSTRLPVDAAKRVCQEAIYGTVLSDPGYNYLALPRAIRLPGSWINLTSPHFYHWFHEELPRLWALPDLPADVRLLIPDPTPTFIWDTLLWLGLEERARPTSERHLIVENLYFLSPTVMQGCPDPIGLQFLRKQFLSHAGTVDASLSRRVYLTRANKTRGILNAAEVDRVFHERGWTILDPERLSLSQQIATFANAKVICGLHGAAFTNLTWCTPGCQVLELFAEGFLNGCYEGIALCLGLRYRWLEFPSDGEFRAQIDTTKLEKALVEMGC